MRDLTITLIMAALTAAFFVAWTRRDRAHQARIDRLLDAHETDRLLELSTRFLAQIEQANVLHHQAQSETHPDVAALVALVDRLCQRIQAPDLAVVDHQMAQPLAFSPPAVPMSSDEGYWEAQDLSKEQLAQMAMAQEVAARA